MKNPEEVKLAKAVSAKMIKRTLLDTRKLAGPVEPIIPREEAIAWTDAMRVAGGAAKELWEAYLTQDREAFHAVVLTCPPFSGPA